MHKNGGSMQKAIQLLLLGILLTAQTLSFAHEAMHLSSGDTELCEMCRLQSSSPAITNLDQYEFPNNPDANAPLQFKSSLNGSCQLAAFHPRAPPLFL